MKQITAIVSKDDATAVQDALVEKGYYVTRLATTGGFLKSGNCTFLSAVEDGEVDEVLGIISEHCKQRRESVPALNTYGYGMDFSQSVPVEVTVGGATVIVTNIEQFLKL